MCIDVKSRRFVVFCHEVWENLWQRSLVFLSFTWFVEIAYIESQGYLGGGKSYGIPWWVPMGFQRGLPMGSQGWFPWDPRVGPLDPVPRPWETICPWGPIGLWTRIYTHIYIYIYGSTLACFMLLLELYMRIQKIEKARMLIRCLILSVYYPLECVSSCWWIDERLDPTIFIAYAIRDALHEH